MLSENIKFYRQLKNMNQTELAKAVQVAPAYISQIEAGHRFPGMKVLVRIANALGMEPSTLIAVNGTTKLSKDEKIELLRKLLTAISEE